MAGTVTTTISDVWGSHKVRTGNYQFDSSYPTGGEAVAAADFNLSQLIDVVVHSTDDARYRAVFDSANSKIKLYLEDGTSGIEAEVANTTDVSAVNVRFIAIGK